jgi:hypothetical protein
MDKGNMILPIENKQCKSASKAKKVTVEVSQYCRKKNGTFHGKTSIHKFILTVPCFTWLLCLKERPFLCKKTRCFHKFHLYLQNPNYFHHNKHKKFKFKKYSKNVVGYS